MFVFPCQPFFSNFAHCVCQSSVGSACSACWPELHGTSTCGPTRSSSMSGNTCDVTSGLSHLKWDLQMCQQYLARMIVDLCVGYIHHGLFSSTAAVRLPKFVACACTCMHVLTFSVILVACLYEHSKGVK